MSPPMTSSPPINALKKPQNKGALKSETESLVTSNSAAPAIMGVESKNDNRADAWRDIPKNNAAVMVTPLRDTPGIIANAWAQPTKNTVINGTVKISGSPF